MAVYLHRPPAKGGKVLLKNPLSIFFERFLALKISAYCALHGSKDRSSFSLKNNFFRGYQIVQYLFGKAMNLLFLEAYGKLLLQAYYLIDAKMQTFRGSFRKQSDLE